MWVCPDNVPRCDVWLDLPFKVVLAVFSWEWKDFIYLRPVSVSAFGALAFTRPRCSWHKVSLHCTVRQNRVFHIEVRPCWSVHFVGKICLVHHISDTTNINCDFKAVKIITDFNLIWRTINQTPNCPSFALKYCSNVGRPCYRSHKRYQYTSNIDIAPKFQNHSRAALPNLESF
jgi:hypothetical protein